MKTSEVLRSVSILLDTVTPNATYSGDVPRSPSDLSHAKRHYALLAEVVNIMADREMLVEALRDVSKMETILQGRRIAREALARLEERPSTTSADSEP